MTETAWTPGPWHADAVNDWNVWSRDCKVAVTIDVSQADSYRDPDKLERIANARLIAAAPDLAEALRQVTEYANVMATFEPDTHDAIVKALARAHGETL